MNRFIMISYLLIMNLNYASSQYLLEIEISGIKSNSGNIMLQLFDENQKVISQEICIITDKKCNINIKDLKPGKYAVRYFHDENLNRVMETNIFGKPTEGYGFSNDVTGKLGPPPFEKWLFELKENKKITLKPVYQN
jgi:uncharacterized protein (DUF2141 family)